MAYQQIIGMGAEALPFIFRELQKEPDHWFWALHAITGENPVSKNAAGDLKAMTSTGLNGHGITGIYESIAVGLLSRLSPPGIVAAFRHKPCRTRTTA